MRLGWAFFINKKGQIKYIIFTFVLNNMFS